MFKVRQNLYFSGLGMKLLLFEEIFIEDIESILRGLGAKKNSMKIFGKFRKIRTQLHHRRHAHGYNSLRSLSVSKWCARGGAVSCSSRICRRSTKRHWQQIRAKSSWLWQLLGCAWVYCAWSIKNEKCACKMYFTLIMYFKQIELNETGSTVCFHSFS